MKITKEKVEALGMAIIIMASLQVYYAHDEWWHWIGMNGFLLLGYYASNYADMKERLKANH